MKRTLALSALATMAASALAIDFENPPYNGSAGGTLLTGQDGWYQPVAGSVEWNVFTYAGNTMGVVANPGGGGAQFAGGISAGATFARAQKDFAWDANTAYTMSYDVNHQYLGQLPTAQNLGSWSLQPSATARFFQDLHTWDDVSTAASWSLVFNAFDSTGLATNALSAGVEWTGLQVNHWYRMEHTFSFATNQVLSTSITDLHTNTTTSFAPAGWYLAGGSAPTQPMPTAYRFFAGGAAGNAFAVDNSNIAVVPEPGTFIAIGAGIALLALRRRRS
ncbi:MAG: PEP-CTERM sorting domain-containing protein [Armatimonadota bacterium]|nr:PEP-CTERM sorting domain-containing protein [Armatimonadota bacterium]